MHKLRETGHIQVVKKLIFLVITAVFTLIQISCNDDEPPKCSFKFKNKKYTSSDVFCIDDTDPIYSGQGLSMDVSESWGTLEIDQRVSVIRFTKETAPNTYYYSDIGTTLTRDGNSLTFSGTVSAQLPNSTAIDTGDFSGKCTCTDSP